MQLLNDFVDLWYVSQVAHVQIIQFLIIAFLLNL